MRRKFVVASFLTSQILSQLVGQLALAAPPLLDKGSSGQGAGQVLTPIPLIELVSPLDNPAKGSLSVKFGEKRETIEFSQKSPYYVIGMVLHASALSDDFKSEFKGKHIIQFTMGTSEPSQGNAADPEGLKTAHWGSVGLVSTKIPSKKKSFITRVSSDSSKENYAQVSLKSPSTPVKQSDEEKLKSIFFSQEGVLTYEPVGEIQEVKLKGERGKLSYKRQKVVLEFNSILGTPFNPADGDVKGRLETYVYWPGKADSQQLTKNLASSSLRNLFTREATPPSTSPTENVNRNVTGTTQKVKD